MVCDDVCKQVLLMLNDNFLNITGIALIFIWHLLGDQQMYGVNKYYINNSGQQSVNIIIICQQYDTYHI